MYKEYYLMQDEPFAPFPSPYLFYKSKNHAKTWKNIVHNLRKKEPVVMVAGEYGTGKTLLCLKMIRFMEKYKIQPRIHIPSPGYDFSMVLEKIARELGLDVNPDNPAACRRSIYEYFETDTPAGNQYLYLIIDDIHEFDYTFISELAKLITFNYNGYFPIKLFMFGHTGFLKSLEQRNLISFKQRVRVVTLSALNMAEVTEYIYFRLIASGASGSPVFNEEAIALITEMSRGLPRLINKICDSSLVIAYKRRVNVIDRSIVAIALAEEGILDFDGHPETIQVPRFQDNVPANPIQHQPDPHKQRIVQRTVRGQEPEPLRKPEIQRRASDLFSDSESKNHSTQRKRIPAMDLKKSSFIDGKTLTIAGLIILIILMMLFFVREMRMSSMPTPSDMTRNSTGSVITKPFHYPVSDKDKEKVVKKDIFRPAPDTTILPERKRVMHPVVEDFFHTRAEGSPLLSGFEKTGPVLYENHVAQVSIRMDDRL
jgi:type II secretory pathway predicted ATPase ExeA